MKHIHEAAKGEAEKKKKKTKGGDLNIDHSRKVGGGE